MDVILRTNAIAVYAFLSTLHARLQAGETLRGKKILDCGAGGPVPPLALFQQHGFEAWGIDASDEQLDRARRFCEEQGIDVHLRQGDMRRLPFEDGAFDYVYEHYSMCHLSKRDTALAAGEMYRVLKPQGLCFLGVISTDSVPKSLFGQERETGEYWGEEGGGGPKLHSMFTDAEIEELVSAWQIVSQEKAIRYLRGVAEKVSMEDWVALYEEAGGGYSPAAWRARYAERVNAYVYAHVHLVLQKPE